MTTIAKLEEVKKALEIALKRVPKLLSQRDGFACTHQLANPDYLQLDAALSALDEVMKEVGWQDINTAPKDETVVILLETYPRKNSASAYHVSTARFVENRWYEVNTSADDGHVGLCDHATHWQPLPQPPAESEGR